MTPPRSGYGFRLLALPLLTSLLVLQSLLSAPAQAAPPKAPTGLSPSGIAVNANPVLGWSAVAKALSYDVEVSTQSDFSPTLLSVSTQNVRVTPTNQLPMTQIYWRVRARNNDGNGPWSSASFARNRLAGPAPLAPDDGAFLPTPGTPPLLRWSPMPGATGYTVEVDRGPGADWVDTVSYDTRTTSFVVPNPQPNGHYAWRVRAYLGEGQSTLPSAPRSYVVGELDPVSQATPHSAQDVEDVVLDWEPVAGAVDYEIRVSTDDQFSQGTIIDSRIVQSTRYSPQTTYDVDDYWWQVRPRNNSGAAKEWASVPIRAFHRAWDPLAASVGPDPNPQPDPYGAPQLLYPTDLSIVSGDLYYQWTPVRLASRYQLQVDSDASFSTPEVCATTTQTTFVVTALGSGQCHPGLNDALFWRVRAIDFPRGVNGFWSPIQRFAYQRPQVTLTSPANGATVAIPTLVWQETAGAASYDVKVTDKNGAQVAQTQTYSTSWTPPNQLPATGSPYTWTVQAVDTEGVRTPLPVLNPGRSFTTSGVAPSSVDPSDPTAADPLSPANGSTHSRFPALTWQAVTGATRYEVWVGDVGVPGVHSIGSQFTYPAATSTAATDITAGSYRWFVRAFNGNTQLAVGDEGYFTIGNPASVTGQRVALDGSGFVSGNPCTRSLAGPVDQQICTGLTATPVLDWSPVAGAGSYRVYLSRDKNFQNMMPGSPFTTSNTRWTPNEALPESQAGTAYYWFVRPCKTQSACAPDPVFASHAFEKRSNAPVTLPITDVANDITFDWQDYLATNLTPAKADPTTGEQPGQSAQTYQVQVSTSDTFNPLLEDVTVDQSTYTAPGRLYPEGPLWWRVRVIDGSGNGLPWTAALPFSKSSPVPAPLGPQGASTVTEPFRWSAVEFAASYEIEVYRNGDVAASPANRVLNARTPLTAFVPSAPLPSGTTYVWRVRRFDVSNNPGAWSGWASYAVAGSAPVLVSPGSSGFVPSRTALFTWMPTAEASAYRFERRQAAANSLAENVRTFGTAWAPTSPIPTGQWEWRVVALDADNAVIAASGWRSFKVDATPPSIKKVKPAPGKLKPKSLVTVVFSEKVRGVSKKSLYITKADSKKHLRAKVKLNSKGTKATIDIKGRFKMNTQYVVHGTRKIKDVAGNVLEGAVKSVVAQPGQKR